MGCAQVGGSDGGKSVCVHSSRCLQDSVGEDYCAEATVYRTCLCMCSCVCLVKCMEEVMHACEMSSKMFKQQAL